MQVVADSTTCRALAIAEWLPQVVDLLGRPLAVVPAVSNRNATGTCEIEQRIRRCEQEIAALNSGSADYSRRMHELVTLGAFLRAGPELVDPVDLTAHETRTAIGLAAPDAAWRSNRSLPKAPFGAGEAESIAVALSRGLVFATDDRAARNACRALGGSGTRWTADLVADLVDAALITENEAAFRWEQLRTRHRFRVPTWDQARRP